MTPKQRADCETIANHYRTTHQCLKAVEEMAELQVELMKFVNSDGGDLDRIFEEIADTCIMIEQLWYLFDHFRYSIDAIINQKLARQLERIKKEEESDGTV